MDSDHSRMRPKTQQACEPCRSLKVRCLPSEQAGICQKCVKSGSLCVFAEQRACRPKRKRDSKGRVAELESKLEELIARVDQSRAQHDGECTTPARDQENIFHAEETSIKLKQDVTMAPASEEAVPGFVMAGRVPEVGIVSPPDMTSGCPELLFETNTLSRERATSYLQLFREMSTYYPFVIVPAKATIQTMQRDRPFLLLATLTAATSSDKKLQRMLGEELRTSLCTKVVIDGEKSLDLLQGLLVYLAWYHFHYIPRKEQSYQLLQMAIGMTVDLALDQKPSDATARRVALHLAHYQRDTGTEDHPEFFSREARRAYLGCYYLSTSLSSVFGKPNHIQYTDYMYQIGKSLKEEMEHPTDKYLLPLIQLQRMGEEAHQTLRMGRSGTQTQMSLLRIQTHVNAFQQQLRDWEASLPSEPQRNVILTMARHSANIHVHEMDLLNPLAPKTKQTQTDLSDKGPPVRSSIRIDILFLCLEASKDFYEAFLSLPVPQYRFVSNVEWGRLIYATVVLYKLSLGSPRIPEWDAQLARNTVRLELYLEALCYRLQSICVPSPEAADLFSILRLIFENVKTTYEQLKQLPQEVSMRTDLKAHETTFPKAAPDRRFQHRCPAFPYWSNQSEPNMPVGNEDWSMMFNNDPFVGAEFPECNDFWGDLMAEAAHGARGEQAFV